MSLPTPDIFFLPLAVPETDARSLGDLDPGVLSRRIPDFLQLLINEGGPAPVAMLEIHSPADQGPARWITLEETPDPEQAFELLESDDPVRAVITGRLTQEDGALCVVLHVYRACDLPTHGTTSLGETIDRGDPVPALRRLADRTALLLGLGRRRTDPGLLTRNGKAFFRFLHGLDGAAVLAGDLPGALADPERSLRPFAEALSLDPGFGLALRAAHFGVRIALAAGATEEPCLRVLDHCLRSAPRDGAGCVDVAEHLVSLGDTSRATAWLEHAVTLRPAPARGLQGLGVLRANRGRVDEAQELWRRGAEEDGHPDFFAHLAWLAFQEGRPEEAWTLLRRGLCRLHERLRRAPEWGEDTRAAGVLLPEIVDRLHEHSPPAEVAEALRALCGTLSDPADRVRLGAALEAIGALEAARVEFQQALDGDLEPEAKDRAVRALLRFEVPDFEERFAAAADRAASRRNPLPALEEFEDFLDLQPAFWPALFFAGVAHRRLGNLDVALDIMAEVLALRPGQPDALAVMGQLFAERGNAKRGLECAEEACESRHDDPDLHALRARCLHALGRREEAEAAIAEALLLDPGRRDLRRLRRAMRR